MRLATTTVVLLTLAKQGGNEAVMRNAAEHAWEVNPVVAGAESATLWGDPKTAAYGALRRVRAGTVLSPHTHTLDQRVVLVSGSIVLTVAPMPPKTLAAGAYAFIPGGAVHDARCETGADCVYFEEQAGPADMKLVPRPQPK